MFTLDCYAKIKVCLSRQTRVKNNQEIAKNTIFHFQPEKMKMFLKCTLFAQC